ncbi:MAG: hypothetical protein KDD70_11885 [Bdellovibrionales bacterium]|nr:hypothetical protein [Bdellovibrionales bacterium]
MQTSSSAGAQDSAQVWKQAKKTAESLGYVPASFSIAVRTLIQDQNEFDASLRPVTKYQVARLLKTPTFKAMLYYGTQDLRSGYIADQDNLTVGSMMDLFEPLDLAAMIACFVYYRKAKKLLNDTQWEYIKEQIDQDSQIGAQIGVSIPTLGIATGLITGTLLQAGLAALIKSNEKAFKEYRRYLNGEGLPYDFKKEEELFGCSSEQVGVFTLSKMGFGVDIGQAFTVAFDLKRDISTIKEPLQLKMRLSRLWIDTLKAGNDQPTKRFPGEFYPVQTERDRLNAEVKKIMGGKFPWLGRRKDDISEEKTPLLFKKMAASDEVPEDLADIFSVDQITAMEEEDFDDLCDHMDEEAEGKDSKDVEDALG